MADKKRTLALAVIALTFSTSVLAQAVQREGVIVSRSGHDLHLRTREGNLTVSVSSSTSIKETKGIGSNTRGPETLIPGLIIKAEGHESGGTLVADKIQFKDRDWRSAVAAKAGTTEQFANQQSQIEKNKAGIGELRQAMIDGQEYEIRQETTVYFATGSAAIAPQYQSHLRDIAHAAPKFGNYRISILGFADPRGNAEANERLSQKRAMAVSNYLRQTGAINPGRVLSPSAMGENGNAPGLDAPKNQDEARRVVVRVVTAKGQLSQNGG